MSEFKIESRNAGPVTVQADNPEEAVKTLMRVAGDEKEIKNFQFIGNNQIRFYLQGDHDSHPHIVILEYTGIWGKTSQGDEMVWEHQN